ncbi:MAG: DNA-binding protein [Thermoproteota archaeon]|nr:MAG: DNA-binding protein [Candidatus Korarchaeota archaeon]RLG48894.1 MAG: DNA-binding protein [Candidatus Korarchaeota archaeon]
MVSRSSDWLRQALRDLELAEEALRGGFYEWTCFASQQAAEKAVKALHQKLGAEVWGHSVSRLLAVLPKQHEPPRQLIDKAKELDQHYILARYPNLHLEGSPMDYYTEEQARRAVSYAREIIDWVSEIVQA